MTRRIVANVRPSGDADGVTIVSAGETTAARLAAILSPLLGSSPPRELGAVRVNGAPLARLASLDPPELELLWTPEAHAMAANRVRAQAALPRMRDTLARLREGGAELARRMLADVDGLDVLDEHQLVNVAAMASPDCFGLCVFDEQGTGKTVTVLHAFDALVERNLADVLVILAPKSMLAEWQRDFERFHGDLYRIAIVAGTPRVRLEALSSEADVYIVGFETAVALEAEIVRLVRRSNGRAVLVVDESYFVKNRSARRSTTARRIREWCERAYVLCGTPAPNAPHDLVAQATLVDFGLAYAHLDIPDDRDAARPVVRAALAERGLYVRNLKQDVLPDLPGRRFTRTLVDFEELQARLYEAARSELVHDLQATDDVRFARELRSFLARRSALLQIASNPVGVAPEYDRVPGKLRALDELLGDALRRDEKVVVWSFYRASIDAICTRYARYGLVRYDGTVASVEARRDAVRRFQEDDETMLFVGNPAAAGAGLTLHRARLAVYESLSNQAAHYLQSLDRIHRRGQERPVDYLFLLSRGSLEPHEFERLQEKQAAAHDLLGDEIELPVTREGLLAELLASDDLTAVA